MNRAKFYGLRGACNPELDGSLHSPLCTAGLQTEAETLLRGHQDFIDDRHRHWYRVQAGLWEEEV